MRKDEPVECFACLRFFVVPWSGVACFEAPGIRGQSACCRGAGLVGGNGGGGVVNENGWWRGSKGRRQNEEG